jgi:hypothetical protein
MLAQAISDLIDCRLGRGHATQAVQQREVVNRAFMANRIHLHAGFFQPAREALAFVEPRIVLSGYDESGRQTLQRLGGGAKLCTLLSKGCSQDRCSARAPLQAVAPGA